MPAPRRPARSTALLLGLAFATSACSPAPTSPPPASLPIVAAGPSSQSSPGRSGSASQSPGSNGTSSPDPALASPPDSGSASPAAARSAAKVQLPPGLLAAAREAGPQFPVGYRGYHTYAELSADLAAVATAHPDLVRVFSIGQSYQGRQIWAARVSQDVGVDHGRPEALFDGVHHALEHLSLEMTLSILHWLVDGYGHDPAVTRLMQTRVVDIVFALNPDGAEYDIAGGRFHTWRKNRQPTPGSSAVGTDLNRNYADHWGCCGLVSANPASPYYRGPAPFSAPETRALARFVASRVIDGRQRITVAITFHTSGRLIMWPFGYTTLGTPGDMRVVDHSVFVAMGRAMAGRDGYRPEQASALYVDSGTARDWEYGRQHIFAFTFELASGLYMPDTAIRSETARNRSAVLYLIGMADCPYRAVGRQAAYCPAS